MAQELSLIEEGKPEARELEPLDSSVPGRVIGVTGPPGVGKSTLINQLISEWRRRDLTVAVIAVDPSSPITGGAWLGDRIRLLSHTRDPRVFIRSVSSRGELGGLSATTANMVSRIGQHGWDRILVETVGVGQNEVDIRKVAELVIVVWSPGVGDTVQIQKAGVLEIADLLVLNQGDHPRFEQARAALQESLAWFQPDITVIPTVATTGEGITQLIDQIEASLDRRD